MVVEGEVVAGDDIDTSILLDLPVGKTEPLGLGEKIRLGELSAPVYKAGKSALELQRLEAGQRHSQASVAFFRSRSTPIRGNPRTADWTILDAGLWIELM